MEELKPCPFCGQKPRIKRGLNSEGKPFFQVTHDCMNLLSQIKTFCRKTEAEAVTDWNRRADPENKPLTLEQLRQMDGEPVWLVLEKSEYQNEYATWAILQISAKGDIGFSHHGCVNYYSEGHPYKAYAHKPEGAETT